MTDRVELFNRWAESYDRSLLDASGFPFEGYHQVLRRLFTLAEPRPGLRVLDLGTGTGALAKLFASVGCDVTGIDFAEEMLTRARHQVPEATFTRADLLGEWPAGMKERSFDVVVSSYVLHEFPDDKKLVLLSRLVRETLTPDGRILIGDILFPNEAARAQAHDTWRDVWDDDEHYAAADELVTALSEQDLSAQFEQVSFCAGVLAVNN